MQENKPLERSCSDIFDRSSALLTDVDTGRIRYRSGYSGLLHRRVRLLTLLDLKSKSFDDAEKYRTRSPVNIEKKNWKIKEWRKPDMENNSNSHLQDMGTGDRLTRKKTEGWKVDYPVRYEFDTDGDTPKQFHQFKKLSLRKTQSTGIKSPVSSQSPTIGLLEDFRKRFNVLRQNQKSVQFPQLRKSISVGSKLPTIHCQGAA